MLLSLICSALATITCEWNDKEYVMKITADSTSTSVKPADITNREQIRKLLIVTTTIKSISDTLMLEMTGLREVKIHSFLQTMGGHCFYGCTALESINIPPSVSSIGQYCFSYCTSLKKIILPKAINIIGTEMIKSSGIETIIALEVTSLTGKFVNSAAFGDTNKLIDFFYCGKADWKGVITTPFINSTVQKPSVPTDYAGTTFWGYDVNKIDVSAKCLEAQSEMTATIDWEYEFQHGYPDPVIIPSSEIIDLFLPTSPIESSFEKVESSLENMESSRIQETSIFRVESSNIMADSSENNGENPIERQTSQSDSNEFGTSFLPSFFENPSNVDDTSIFYDQEQYSSENDVNDYKKQETSLESSMLDEYDTSSNILPDQDNYGSSSILETISPSVTNNNDPLTFIWKPKIRNLIVQNIENLYRNDIIEFLGKNAHEIIWKLVILPGVKVLGDSLMENSSVKKVVIADSVTSIGKNCFYNCRYLKILRLPNGLDSIGERAFGETKSLKTLVLPDRISDLGEFLIERSGLVNITLLNTTIKPIKIAMYVYANSKSMDKFIYCGDSYYGGSYNYKAFDGSSAKMIMVPKTFKDKFYGDYTFLNYIPTLSDIKDLCEETEAKQKEEVDWQYETTHGYAPSPSPTPSQSPEPTQSPKPSRTPGFDISDPIYFDEFNSILILQYRYVITKQVIIREYKYDITPLASKLLVRSYVEELGDDLLNDATNLKEVLLGDTVKIIGNRCFANCKNLNRLRLSQNLEVIGDSAFENTTSLTEIVFPSKMTNLGSYLIWNSGIITGTILNTTIKPKSVESYVFANAVAMESFYYCGDTYLFKPSQSIHSFQFSNLLHTEDVSVPRTFKDSFFLGWTVKRSDPNTNSVCQKSKEYLEKTIDWDKEMSNGFGPSYISLNKEDGVLTTNYAKIESGTVEFILDGLGKSKIQHVNLNNGVKVIGASCFKDYTELTEVILGETVQVIGVSSFSGCKKLSKINFPRNIQEIGNYAFAYCSLLTRIVIPSTVEFIGSNVLKESGIQNIFYLSPDVAQPIVETEAFTDLPNIKLFVYCGLTFQNTSIDSFIDPKVLVTVDFLYKKSEFLGRDIIRDENTLNICKDNGELNVKPFNINKVNRKVLAISFTVIFAAIVIVLGIFLFVCCSGKEKYRYLNQTNKSESAELIDIDIEDGDGNGNEEM